MGDCKGVVVYGVCMKKESCNYLMRVPREHRCEFVHKVHDCHFENTFHQYLDYLACHCNNTEYQMYYCVLLFIVHLVYYFFIMMNLAEFFTPSLCYISNVMGMSEAMAGATLLSLGNACPDIITAMVEATAFGPEMVLGQVLGVGVHITTMLLACTILTRQFHVKLWHFVRTTIPPLILMLWLFLSYGRNIYMWHVFVYLGLLVAYLALNCCQECFMRRKKPLRRQNKGRSGGGEPGSEISTGDQQQRRMSPLGEVDLSQAHLALAGELEGDEPESHPIASVLIESMKGDQTEQEIHEVQRRRESLEMMGVDMPPPVIARDRAAPRVSLLTAALQTERLNALYMLGLEEQAKEEAMGNPSTVAVEVEGKVLYYKSKGLWKDFCRHMDPIDKDLWHKSKVHGKLYQLMESPILYVLKIFIPCVHEGVLCNNWCKLLACVQCYTVPMLVLWAIQLYAFDLNTIFVPVVSVVGAIAIVFSSLILANARVRRAPRYHILFAMVSIVATVIILYAVCNEVVAIFRSLGAVYGLSDSILVLTFLPWGNAIEDLMNCIHLSHSGYSKMAFTGCFGTFVMVGLVGSFFAVLFIVLGTEDGEYVYKKEHPELMYTAMFFVVVNILTFMFIVPTVNFHVRKSIAFYLLGLDLMYVISVFLIEFLNRLWE